MDEGGCFEFIGLAVQAHGTGRPGTRASRPGRKPAHAGMPVFAPPTWSRTAELFPSRDGREKKRTAWRGPCSSSGLTFVTPDCNSACKSGGIRTLSGSEFRLRLQNVCGLVTRGHFTGNLIAAARGGQHAGLRAIKQLNQILNRYALKK